MKYFADCKTIDDVKSTFRALAKRLHPDNAETGDPVAFREMMSEYEKAFERLKNIHQTQTGETYEKATTETAEAFADIILNILSMDGVEIEIIGSWIWLTGATLLYKDDIKAAGFWWSKSKKAWYYNGDGKKSHRRGRYNMDQLRQKWGSEKIMKEEPRKIG